MMHLQPGFSSLHGNAQLFLQLPAKRLVHRFAILNLAAGEFPQPALMNVIRPAADQRLTRRVEQDADSDMHRIHVRYSALMRT